MPAVYEIRWLPHGPIEQFFGSRGNYYEFSESDRLDLHSVPVWWHRCARFTEGEYLSTVEEIDKQIRDLHDPTPVWYHMTRHELLPNRLAELQRRRCWRAARQSPPKCIHCSSTEIAMLPEGEPFPHPHGDGTIRVDCVGMCSTSFNEWFFTLEGDRIPRETQPTYWHHPELDKPHQRRGLMNRLRSKPKGGGQADS